MLTYIIPFIVLILIVVFIHEYGHYYFAKKYDSKAYITIIEHDKILNDAAIQIFTKKGPLAFLPISNRETSIVFSVYNMNNQKDESIEQILKDKNLKTVEKDKINKELELVNDELLRIDEILGQTRETLGETHLRVVDQGESIEAYGPEEFDRMEKIRRRNSKQGKALLNKINLQ